MLEAFIIYLLLGCFAGFVAGLLGVGGGLVIVPVLVFVFQEQGFDGATIMHLALGTSLATIVFTAVSAVFAHHCRGAVVWTVVRSLSGGLLLGGFVGAVLADSIQSDGLKQFFVFFELIVAVYMMAGTPVLQRALDAVIRKLELFFVGSVIGTFSAVLGIGGGTMTVPYLCWRGCDMRQAVAISSACGLPIALAGAVGYVWVGLDAVPLPPMSTGYIHWPAVFGIVITSLLFAPLGALLAHHLPVRQLKRVFGVVLLLMALMMINI